MLIYYFIYTSTPRRRSSKIWPTKIRVGLFKCLSRRMHPFSRWKVISWEYDVILTPLCRLTNFFLVFLKTIYTEEVHHGKLCKAENGEVRQRRGAHKSAFQVCFLSGLTPIDPFCHLKSTERNMNVSRTLAHTWHGRFSDSSTDNTSRGLTKY